MAPGRRGEPVPFGIMPPPSLSCTNGIDSTVLPVPSPDYTHCTDSTKFSAGKRSSSSSPLRQCRTLDSSSHPPLGVDEKLD